MARRIFEQNVSSDNPVNFMCNNMGFLKIYSLATLVAIFSFLVYILSYWVQTKSMFYRWLHLGASPFLLISYRNFYFAILFWKFHFIPDLRSTERRPIGRGREQKMLKIFWAGRGWGWRWRRCPRPSTRQKILKNRHPRILSSPSCSPQFQSRTDVFVPVLFLASKVIWYKVKISELNCKIKVSIWNKQKRRSSEVQPSVEHRFRLDSVS